MKEYEVIALENQRRAKAVLAELKLIEYFKDNGCRVNLIGSLKMGLLVKHLDIDIHIYSRNITEERSFEIISRLSKNPRIKGIRCINGLFTDEHCMAWHLQYEDKSRRLWQIDIIHIEEGSHYDGFFERMAERICKRLSTGQRDAILRLKYETPEGEEIHGVEYYQAVMEYGVRTMDELRRWVAEHRNPEGIYWIPE